MMSQNDKQLTDNLDDMINLDDIIKDNQLTLLSSTPVKLLCNIDQMLINCFYRGVPYYIDSVNCKYCKDHRYKLNNENLVCKKHYALNLYNTPSTRVSSVTIKNDKYIVFSRFVKRETENCTYIFYLTPLHIDQTRFRVFVYPKGLFDPNKEIVYDWKVLEYPRHFTFSIKMDPYILDCTNPSNITFFKI